MKSNFKKNAFKMGRIIIIFGVMILLFGCAENNQDDYALQEGYFEDSAVEGLKYKTISNDGKTDKDGKFYYCSGEMITFYVGDIQLGESVPAKPFMTPRDLVPKDKGDPEKNKLLIARFLQTLDADNSPDNGILITEDIHNSAVKTDSFDPKSVIFIADAEIGITPTSTTVTLEACEQSLNNALNYFKANNSLPITTHFVNENQALRHLTAAETKQDLIEKGATETSSNIDPNISVHRDEMGVWFLTGPADADLYSVFYEVGYQVAKDRLWQLEKYRRIATGTLSEVLGEKYLKNDLIVRKTGYSQEQLNTGYENLDEDSKKIIKGYVDGINCWVTFVKKDENISKLPLEFVALSTQAGTDIEPMEWTVADLLAVNVFVQRQFDPEALEFDHGQLENIQLLDRLTKEHGPSVGMTMFQDLRWTNDPEALTYIKEMDVPNEWKTNTQKRMNPALSMHQIPDYSDTINGLQQFMRKVKNNLIDINANIKMGSYAWVVGPGKTRDGKPIIYAGPQMGFDSPAICIECSIDAGGLKVSGMMIPGVPGVILGRTPHHAWSLQVGHAHTTDFYFAFDTSNVVEDRESETINVANGEPVEIIFYKINNRPILSPLSFNPDSYTHLNHSNPIVSWRYSHFNHEFNMVSAMLDIARAESIDAFGEGIKKMGVSQHVCYADKDKNIAYWMSGRDPIRPDAPHTFGYQLPQGSIPPGYTPVEDFGEPKENPHLINPSCGYFAGWNNKAYPGYPGTPNNVDYNTGPFHRSHVIDDYLANNNDLTYENVRDLAINIATTKSIGKAGNPWIFVKEIFSEAVELSSTNERQNALDILNAWDGHFVKGQENRASGMDCSDGWMLMDKWIRKVIKKTFTPYLSLLSKSDNSGTDNSAEGDDESDLLFGNEYQRRLFNVIIRSFKGQCGFDWFNNTELTQNANNTELAQNAMKNKAYSIIVEALDETLADLGARPWGTDKREKIEINNDVVTNVKIFTIKEICKELAALSSDPDVRALTSLVDGANIITLTNIIAKMPVPYNSNLLGLLDANFYEIPFSSRSTYAQCVQMGSDGPDRIESFFLFGQSGHIRWPMMLLGATDPQFKHFLAPYYSSFYDEHFFDMSTQYYDKFIHRNFPLFYK